MFGSGYEGGEAHKIVKCQTWNTGSESMVLSLPNLAWSLKFLQPIEVFAAKFLQPSGLVWFYGISTFVGYLTPNPFLCK